MEFDPVVQKLLEDLVSSDDQLRVTATRELADCGPLECIPFLEKAMGDENFVVQASAEKAISRIRVRVKREHEEALKREEQQRKLDELRKAEEARLAAEEAAREKEIVIEEVLSEEEIERIRREEIKRIEIEKQQKAEELRRLEEQRRKDELKLQEEDRKRQEDERRKAEELLRGKVRQETARQKGLVEYNGEWLTEEEVKLREAALQEEEEKKIAAFKRAKARKRKQNLTEIDKLITEKEHWFLKLANIGIRGGLLTILLIMVGFYSYKPLVTIFSMLLILFVAMAVYMIYLLVDAELQIYRLRIYEVEGETFVIKKKMDRGWILDRVRRAALSRDSSMHSRFARELETKTEEAGGDDTAKDGDSDGE